jgi:hypothetical protein
MAPAGANSAIHGDSNRARSDDINGRSVAHSRRSLPPSPLFDEPWRMAVAKRIPLMVTGTAVSIGAFLDDLKLLLPAPLTVVDCGCTLSLKGASVGTVILHNVDRCGIAAQWQLLEWLHMRPLGMQVVSTSSCSVFALTATGAFLDTLYYRLNTVCVESIAPAP